MRARKQCLLAVLVLVLFGVPCIFLGMTRSRGAPSDGGAREMIVAGPGRADSVRHMRACVENGLDPILSSARTGHLDALMGMLDQGADPNMRGPKGWRALHYAAARADWDMVSLLLGHGADVQARTDASHTALHVASRHRGDGKPCNGQGIVMLVDAGLDVDARDQCGGTPLHSTVRAGRTNHVTVLADLGADLAARDEAGMTPLAHAQEWNFRPGIVEALRGLGAVE